MTTCDLPIGTFVLVREHAVDARENGRADAPRVFVARIGGYDMGHSKYNLDVRRGGWGEWAWTSSLRYCFANQIVVVLTAELAEAELVQRDAEILLFEMEWDPDGDGGGRVWRLLDGEILELESHASYQAACDAHGLLGWKS